MRNLLFTLWLISLGLVLQAQDTLTISLEQAIQQSEYSVDALVAKNEFRAGYWEYRTYKAELLPEVALEGTLPYYSKSYNQLQNTDGTYSYVSNDYSRVDGNLSINQNIPFTGGKLSVETSLQRLDQYGDNTITSYLGIPFQVKFEQPLNGFNRMKWLNKIEPIKYNEAKAVLASKLEDVRLRAIDYYFNLLLAQSNLEIALQNYKNTDKLFSVAKAKRNIGQISENDLLQLNVSLLNAESYLSNAQTTCNARMFQLRTFLGYNENVVIKPLVPDAIIQQLVLEYQNVLNLALESNPFTQNIKRRSLEVSRDVSEAKSKRWNANLVVSVGMSGQEANIPDAYNNLRNNQLVNIGVRVPILDWGRSKGRVKIAESNKELTISRIEKEQLEFNQNIFIQVENFNKQFKQLSIAQETDKIAQIRYNTSIEAFILGQMDVLNLNDAQASKDEARRNYIEQNYLLWAYYYQLRGLTLFDFISNQKLITDFDVLVK